LIKASIYEQFCGGETIEECEGVINKLAASHIGTVLDYAVEGKQPRMILTALKTRSSAPSNGQKTIPSSRSQFLR
jgi:proline dehydrogenase